MSVGDRFVRRKIVWVVDEIARKPDFSLNAKVCGEQTGPWRVLLRREDRPLDTRQWIEVDTLESRGFAELIPGSHRCATRVTFNDDGTIEH